MHERAVARSVLAAVLEAAGGARVVAVRGSVTTGEALTPGALEAHFAACAAGTAAEGARLAMLLVRVDVTGRAHEHAEVRIDAIDVD